MGSMETTSALIESLKTSHAALIFARGAYRKSHDALKPRYAIGCTCAGAAKTLAEVLNNKLYRPSFPYLLSAGVGHQSAGCRGSEHSSRRWRVKMHPLIHQKRNKPMDSGAISGYSPPIYFVTKHQDRCNRPFWLDF